jgi:hypothetical protein
VVIVFAVEVLLPFFFLVPLRALQTISAAAQAFLMLLISLTGNYNFFNILTVILCLSVLDDSGECGFGKRARHRHRHR